MVLSYKGRDPQYNYRIAEITFKESEMPKMEKLQQVMADLGWDIDIVTEDYAICEVDDIEAYNMFKEDWKQAKKGLGVTGSEMPDGYLRTTRLSTPSIKTDDQRNALEAFELAISQKFKQFDDFMNRQAYLTSESSWTGYIEEYPEGYLIKLEGTRSGFNAFVSGDSVIRKPVRLSDMIGYYDVSGNEGQMYFMSRRRER